MCLGFRDLTVLFTITSNNQRFLGLTPKGALALLRLVTSSLLGLSAILYPCSSFNQGLKLFRRLDMAARSLP
jgi:hypothetical protein